VADHRTLTAGDRFRQGGHVLSRRPRVASIFTVGDQPAVVAAEIADKLTSGLDPSAKSSRQQLVIA
jgi:hypothetical protein